jgi:hypothetical protein
MMTADNYIESQSTEIPIDLLLLNTYDLILTTYYLKAKP